MQNVWVHQLILLFTKKVDKLAYKKLEFSTKVGTIVDGSKVL